MFMSIFIKYNKLLCSNKGRFRNLQARLSIYHLIRQTNAIKYLKVFISIENKLYIG